MIKEAIILAGGLGTRLRSVVADVPKCMAPVNGIPFIDFVITYLKGEGIERFIFSVGYKSEIITEHLNTHFKELDKIYVTEDTPLGTGGAIKKACEAVNGQEVVIVNGDTIFNINLERLLEIHHASNADCSIGLHMMTNFNRYGTVTFDDNGIITAFYEKKQCAKGFINGGIYILNTKRFLQKELPDTFSFEKEYLERYVTDGIFAGEVFYNYFIDIGVPEDYEQFQQKYSGYKSPAVSGAESGDIAGDGFGILIETIAAFFELLD